MDDDIFGIDYTRLVRAGSRTKLPSLSSRMMRQSSAGNLLRQYSSNSLKRQSSSNSLPKAGSNTIPGFRSRSSSFSSTNSGDSSWFRPNHRASYSSINDVETSDAGEAGDATDGHMTADEMDEKRKKNMAYEYLCHLEEAKKWIEACTNEELPLTTELEENLQNGVILAKLGHFFAPKAVPIKKIYDIDMKRFKSTGLHYRHTDNVVQFFGACETAGLPSIFYPDTSDVYDRKNMPKLVYCIHALSLFLHKLGKATLIQDLVGKAEFTEEEISAMRGELDKYGIQMPAFGKIGGILANEMPVNEAGLHAAVIAINEAIEKDDAQETLLALQNPMALISCVEVDFTNLYHGCLSNAKKVKATTNASKNTDGESKDKDVYDVLLTQAEIQEHINQINVQATLKRVDHALSSFDVNQLGSSLSSKFLNFSQLDLGNVDYYMEMLRRIREMKQMNSLTTSMELDLSEIQQSIFSSNYDCNFEAQKSVSVAKVNKALASTDKDQLIEALDDPKAKYPAVHKHALPLYFEEFMIMKEDKQPADLVYEEIYGGIEVVGAAARVNKAVHATAEQLLIALNDKAVRLTDVEPRNIGVYHEEFVKALKNKEERKNQMLTHSEIQETLHVSNEYVDSEEARMIAVEQIIEALSGTDTEHVYKLLSEAEFENLHVEQAPHYLNCLKKALDNNPEGQALIWHQIQASIDFANSQAEQGVQLSKVIFQINEVLAEISPVEKLYSALVAFTALSESILKEKAVNYFQQLKGFKATKSVCGETGSGWMETTLPDQTKIYYNTRTGAYKWNPSDDMVVDHSLLNGPEIQDIVIQTNLEEKHKDFLNSNTDKIVKIQSTYRAYAARKQYKDRLNYLNEQESHVIKLQALAKGTNQRRKYLGRLKHFKDSTESVVKIQSGARTFLAKKHLKERVAYLHNQTGSVLKIQAVWRGANTRQEYQSLMFATAPPLKVVRKYVHLLVQTDSDYSEEIQLEKTKQQVVGAIRGNQQLENAAGSMDVKIGLLVKNRITLEEVIAHEGKISKSSYSLSGGLTSITKESQLRRDAYGHLFYQLQINPQYLAKLILEMPQQLSTGFITSVILSLYNYASNDRDEFLLLKLCSTSLQQEILEKVENIGEIVTGNPLSVKMVVNFHRNAKGHSYLRNMLNPLITSLLDDDSIRINTNPIDVYKSWVNQTETSSGVPSELPYDVTNQEALQHPEVQARMDETIAQLRVWSDKFLSLILSSLDEIPYGMRFTAKVMYNSLTKKFPEATEKGILVIVGNLLYYRYINSTIVAPDAYDIIDTSVEDGGLSVEQRRNLGTIAKVLQLAASNRGFDGDNQHLSCLNIYMETAYEKFIQYFRKACDVDEPEKHYNIDEYTDATLVVTPQISISANDIVSTHSKLLEYRSKIAPDASDIIHELLDDLGENAPTIEELLGGETKDEEISLPLSNKHGAIDDNSADMKSLFIRTKQLTIDIISCQRGETLTEVLDSPTTDEQELQHRTMIAKQEQVDARAEVDDVSLTRSKSLHEQRERKLSLAEKKTKVKENLDRLMEREATSLDELSEQVILAIAKDIRNQGRHKAERRQALKKLDDTWANLQKKKAFFESQIDYYKTYVQACLDNMLASGKRRSRSSYISVSSAGTPEEDTRKEKKVKKRVAKYTAAKLHERGIVLEIDGCTPNQYKNVQFEIGTTDDPNVFQCTAKVLTVSETHLLKLQELLELQYEGTAVMVLFGRAKVNVNLLIHFLNKKFYFTK